MVAGEELVAYMGGVQAAQRDLRDLGLVWQMIEASAAISCPEDAETVLPTLVRTRERFDGLQARLVEQMSSEHRDALGDQLGARAQCAIDILVRNLFERTADVGFLSIDDDVRAFCALAPDARAEAQPAMVRRLAEYQSKYTVYDEVMLLAPDGTVLARLHEGAVPARSGDPIVAEALAATGYVERFRCSDLAADGSPALLYAQRIASASGAALGVLVLRFRFVDEMHYVFAGMADERHEIALVLVDAAQRVIVSNDDAHVPVGARLHEIESGVVTLTSFAGREYLAVACASSGYQGYAGPPWRAVAMVSLMTAFRRSGPPDDDAARDVPLDKHALHEVANGADDINRDLRRVVWNGQLQASAREGDRRRLKAVLQQVDKAGRRTRERVAGAILELHRTSLGRLRRQVGELARLSSDILDRNLYERANDCRWWALSPALRHLLAAPADAANRQAIGALLEHVNSLYTVYSRLVVFDAQGRLRGASRPGAGGALPAEQIDPAWLEAVRRLRGSQAYHVSPFADTPLHDHGPTWVYLAALNDPQDDGVLRGGIGIVFHATRELGTMLRDVLGERAGVAAFVEEGRRVIAATDLPLAQAIVKAAAGGQSLVVVDGVHYAWARAAAGGYREFIARDGYQHHVEAFVALRLGAQERRQTAYSDVALSAVVPGTRERALELAVFQVGPMRCALPTGDLVEAQPLEALVRVPAGLEPAIGLANVGHGRMVPVLNARASLGIDYPPRRTDGMLLVLRGAESAEPAFALVIDDVLGVLEVDPASLHEGPLGFRQFMPWLAGVLDVHSGDGGRVLVQVLDAGRIRAGVGLGLSAAAPDPLQAGTEGRPASAIASSFSS